MNRRQALNRMFAAGSAAGLTVTTAPEPLQAYQAATSRGLPRLKITDVKLIQTQVGRNFLTNVKVLTSEPGLYGVGCGTHSERPVIVGETIDKYLKPLVVGHYVDEIEWLWQTEWVAPYWRASVDASNAMSAIDGALWDIMGKRAGMPVYALLGGKVREGCRMFTNVRGRRSLQELEDGVRQAMEDGYQHVRISGVSAPGEGGGRGGPPTGRQRERAFSDGAYIDGLVRAFKHLRETVGYSVELCHDVHERPSPQGALVLAKAIEEYRPFFMEDFFAPEDSAWHKILREQSAVPIAMGELFVNNNEWLPLVANRYIDFFRMHISAGGGLNLARKIAHCCEFFGVRMAWHGPSNVSPVGHAVNLHLDFATPNFGIGEGGDFSDQMKELFPGTPELRNGVRYSNDLPGLGIDINEEIAAKHPLTGPGSNRGGTDTEGAPRRP